MASRTTGRNHTDEQAVGQSGVAVRLRRSLP